MDQFDLLAINKSTSVRTVYVGGHKLASSNSIGGHNVGEFDWHMPAFKALKLMPCKFLDCFYSAL